MGNPFVLKQNKNIETEREKTCLGHVELNDITVLKRNHCLGFESAFYEMFRIISFE